MRMRRKPWARPELDVSEIYIKDPVRWRGHWQESFEKKQPLTVELGCGKGGFISQKGFLHPERNFLALDIKSEMLALAKRNVEAVYGTPAAPNIRLSAYNIELIYQILSEEDVAEDIYINFCNPWPKTKHRKRRLTHPKQLNSYKTFLRKGGKIYFKTDDDELFRDSLEYFTQSGFSLDFVSFDIYRYEMPENIVTEHEKMFTDEGIKIKGLIAVSDGVVDRELLEMPEKMRRRGKKRNGQE
ncbi:MAG: tRNA (guanosine(46)-N7)-methyltransferase TrmB [Oscillospiraceae bacterium]|nr:tRNA (guanosine(46)-N7)-methyltransferase TrmB [Oscillospiraceae bacterium]